jgi:hypothetical protein
MKIGIEINDPSEAWLRGTYSIDVDSNLVNVRFEAGNFTNEQNLAVVLSLIKQVQKIFDQNPGKMFYFLVDLSALENMIDYLSKPVRTEYARLANLPQVAKIAAYGVSMYYKVAIDFIVEMVAKKDTIKIFKTKDGGLEWLKASMAMEKK